VTLQRLKKGLPPWSVTFNPMTEFQITTPTCFTLLYCSDSVTVQAEIADGSEFFKLDESLIQIGPPYLSSIQLTTPYHLPKVDEPILAISTNLNNIKSIEIGGATKIKNW
jgi:hypothetical protein